MAPQAPTISIVDDDESVRVSLEGLIRSLGYHVRAYDSAIAFLASDAPEAPDCVISDVQMPGMTGIELKEAMVAAGSSTPVILITAFADDAALARAKKAGVVCFLRKPFSGDNLVRCLNKALET